MLKNMQCLRRRALKVLRSPLSTATNGNVENVHETKLTYEAASKDNRYVKYTDEEKEKILKIINNGNIDDLLRYSNPIEEFIQKFDSLNYLQLRHL